MKFYQYIAFLLFAFSLFAFSQHSHAELRIDVTRGVMEPMPVAITSFNAEGGPRNLATDIPNLVTENLKSSGLFKPVNPKAFVQSPQSIAKDGVRFGEWRALAAPALVTGSITKGSDGRARVEFRLWDVFSQKQLMGMAYMTTQDNWRRIAHIISDDIYEQLTGEGGYFDSRIVYIAETGPPQKRIKRLAIMDQDGANHKYLTDGSSLVLTPRFSPTEQKIVYMSYERGGPQVYIYNLSTGSHVPLGQFPGMTFAPRFSPDGKKVIMSLSQGGNSDIYEMDLRSKKKRRLTENGAIDTAPTYAPDGRQIAFESDRGGAQQLYTMSSSGSNIKRITFGKGRYANPVWSPRGDLIAFTKMLGGKFYIGVIRPDGSGERLIANAYHVEGPTWSPNGRVLSYFKERPVGPGGNQRQAKVFTVDITGYNEQRLPTPRDGSDPAWSPLNE